MFSSILEDIKGTFKWGNMVSRIIIVNVAIFILINIFKLVDPNPDQHIFQMLYKNFTIPGDFGLLIRRPWVLLTYMFSHQAFFHILWNMLLFYWFGRRVGDWLGDKHILPLYISSGLFGALIFVLFYVVSPINGTNVFGIGASGAVMAFVFAAAALNPDGIIRLLLLGDVRLKYVALGIIVLDLLFNAPKNPGSFIVHLAGAIFGVLFIWMLRKGTNISNPFANRRSKPKIKKTKREKFKVVHNQVQTKNFQSGNSKTPINHQEELDRILDKINKEGIEKLSPTEKEFLNKMSKE